MVKLLEGPGGGREDLQKVCKPQFDNVKWFRPKATRRESKEVFLIATGRRTFASFTESASGSNDDDRETDTPSAGPLRVSKILAMRDLCSRREAEALIDTGEVSVNGEVVVLGAKADPTAEVRVTGPVLRRHQSKRTTALNKPGGYVSNLPADGEVEASALLRLSDETVEFVDRPRLSVCGRLDKHSRGLLVLTEDGTLARDIIAGDSVAKTYLVEVARAVTREDLRRLNGPLDFGADEDVSLKTDSGPATGAHAPRVCASRREESADSTRVRWNRAARRRSTASTDGEERFGKSPRRAVGGRCRNSRRTNSKPLRLSLGQSS